MNIYIEKEETLPEGIIRVAFHDGKVPVYARGAHGEMSLLIPEGAKEKRNRRTCILLARQIVALAKQNEISEFAIRLDDIKKVTKGWKDEQDLAEILAVNFEMANFAFTKYKTDPTAGKRVENIYVVLEKKNDAKKVKSGLERGKIVGEEVNGTRMLSNTPGGDMTPTLLANEAEKLFKGRKVKVTVLDEKEIKKLGMGGVLGVSAGSDDRPKFIIMEYMSGKKNEKPIVLIGKGVTFDTGGLNLKPSDGILEMHMDMSGGASVIHAVSTAERLGIKKNIVGLVPAVENMPSGSSYRPGDILKSMSGLTIEVRNTDAEGRIILADALTYAKKYEPRLVVDVATLTGASLVALGLHASALMTRDARLENTFRALGEQSGDYVWPLPMWDEYEPEVRGEFGDWANLSVKYPKYAGATTAGMFLYQFAKDYPWVHLDIAPRMTAVEGEFLSKGAVGAPVRLLVKLLESY